MNPSAVPEEAVIDAAWFDPLGAAALMSALANRGSVPVSAILLAEICRKADLTPERTRRLVATFEAAQLIRAGREGYVLAMLSDEAARHAAVLRGVAYAQYRHRDANQVEITLSPPAHPSRLMEKLTQTGFSWARLYHTKDSLIELASQAQRRLVIVSPFLDSEGVEWIGQLFEAVASADVERMLIIRGREEGELDALSEHQLQLVTRRVKILTYAVTHDPGTRALSVETFHAKIILADSDKAYIGSANMTRWSLDFSMECGVIVRGPCVRPVATLVDANISVSDIWPGYQDAS